MGLIRLYKILHIFIKHRLDSLIETSNNAYLNGLLKLLAKLPSQQESRGESLRLALEELGPVFIKFGQMLSTRRDLVPQDLVDELAKLQDDVPPFDSQVAIALIEKQLGKNIDDIYAEFDSKVLASASIAQVHPAILKSGESVVVKVVRPGIEKIIASDIKLLFTFAKLIKRFHPDGSRLRPVEVVENYQFTLLDELNLSIEAANTSQLKRNFDGSPMLYVPEVHWDFCASKVMTMERIDGIPINDLEALNAQHTHLKLLAERGVEIFFTQLLRDNFFHADMHPGNVFVSKKNPQSPQYIAIDCAVIGSLSEADKYYIARNLLAIFERDYALVAQLHLECGWVPEHVDPHQFEAAIRAVCEPIFKKPISEIAFGQVMLSLFQTARRFEMEVQPSLVLLQKTLFNIEGLGRELYPSLDLWATAKPQIQQWLKERYSPKALWQRTKLHAPELLEQLPDLPSKLLSSLEQTQKLEKIAEQHRKQLETIAKQSQKRRYNHAKTSLAAVLIIAAAYLAKPSLFNWLQDLPILSWLLLAIAATILLSQLNNKDS